MAPNTVQPEQAIQLWLVWNVGHADDVSTRWRD